MARRPRQLAPGPRNRPGRGTREAAWVHAYLHRVEGDTFNANYWYRRAHRPPPTTNLPTEWEAITRELLANQA